MANPSLLIEYYDEFNEYGDVTTPGIVTVINDLVQVNYNASQRFPTPNSYVLAKDINQNPIFRRFPNTKKIEDAIDYCQMATVHAIVASRFNPEGLAVMVNDNEVWSNCTFHSEYPSIDDAFAVTQQMFTFARENKEFARDRPCEIILNNDPIQSITVFDMGKVGIMYKIKHTDRSITLGQVLFKGEGFLAYQSDSMGTPAIHNENVEHRIDVVALVSAMTRDLFVLETVDKEYRTKSYAAPKGSKKRKRKKPQEKKYTWIAKRRINYIGDDTSLLDRMHEVAPKIKYERSGSRVVGHPRRANNPNHAQLALAKEHEVFIPEGYTYVKPHDRSGGEVERKLYKSRSAFQTLFGA